MAAGLLEEAVQYREIASTRRTTIRDFKLSREHTGLSKTHAKRRRWINLASGNLPNYGGGWFCVKCGMSYSDFRFFDVDHILATQAGGGDNAENLQVLCPNCHRLKHLE
jgi:hypothetical protein